MKRILLLFVASLVTTGALGGCAYSGWPRGWFYRDQMPAWDAFPYWNQWSHWGVAYADREPPPPPIEVIPDSPGDKYAWVGGHWRWQHNDFEWVQGHWAKPEAGTYEWIPGRWSYDRYGWYYVNGHWQ